MTATRAEIVPHSYLPAVLDLLPSQELSGLVYFIQTSSATRVAPGNVPRSV